MTKDTIVSQFTEETSVLYNDRVPFISDPSGSPKARIAPINNFLAGPEVKVAASDAPAKWKKHADYICTGVSDGAQIELAVAEAAVVGGKVKLSPGTFNCNINMGAVDYVWLQGSGLGTKLVAEALDDHVIEGRDCHYIIISDMYLDGRQVAGQTEATTEFIDIHSLHIERCFFHDNAIRGAQVRAIAANSWVWLKDCEFDLCDRNAVGICWCNGVWIDGNIVHDSGDVALEVSGGDIDQVHITNNTILDSSQGIAAEDGRYMVISGNIIRGVTSNGIHVDHTVLDPGHDVIISNNYIEASASGGASGIAVNTVKGCQIKNNIVIGKFNNHLIRIYAADHIVQGNHLYFGVTASGAGVFCDTDSDGATIDGNTFYGFNDLNDGISSDGNDSLTISNNVFFDASVCINLANSTEHHIRGNTWHSSAGGIYLDGVTYSVVQGNAGYDTTYTATDIVESGTADNNLIRNNYVRGRYSIVVVGASTIARDNDYPGYAVAAFLANDTSPSVAIGNIFKTANSAPTTITMFDNGYIGKQITVIINDDNTIIDFSSSTLKGSGGVDFHPLTGDFLTAIYDGTNWYCSVNAVTQVGGRWNA